MYAQDPSTITNEHIKEEPYVVDLLPTGLRRIRNFKSQCSLDDKANNSVFCNIIDSKCEFSSGDMSFDNQSRFKLIYQPNKKSYQIWNFGQVVKSTFGQKLNRSLTSIDEIKLSGFGEKDMKQFFDYKEGFVHISPKLNITENALKDTVITMKGKCDEANLSQKFEFPVFSAPSSKTKIGTILLKFLPTPTLPSISLEYEGEVFFSPETISEYYYCEVLEESHVLYQVYGVDKNWSNLGKGPWGEVGWIEFKAEKLFDIPFMYSIKDFSSAKLQNIGKGIIQISNEEYSTKVPYKELLSPEGKVKLSINCEPGG